MEINIDINSPNTRTGDVRSMITEPRHVVTKEHVDILTHVPAVSVSRQGTEENKNRST